MGGALSIAYNCSTLKKVKSHIHELELAISPGRIRPFRKDRQSIVEMKKQVDAALEPFGPSVRTSINVHHRIYLRI